MFDRLTEKAIKVIMLAQEEARRLKHSQVESEHILLGLMGEGTSVAALTLKHSHLTLKDLRLQVEIATGRGTKIPPLIIDFAESGKTLLGKAWDAAAELGDNYIGAEHLLLGLLSVEDSVAAKVLVTSGVECAQIKSELLRLLGRSPRSGPSNEAPTTEPST